LIVGHQYIAQLEEDKSTKVRDAIFGNVGTIVVFRIGAVDAEFLETEFEPIFTPADLVNLPKYSIILKLMINGVASDPFSAITLAPNPAHLTGNSEKVLKVSRERYANPAAEVEEKISRWMGAEYHQEAAVVIGAQNEEEKESTPAEQNQAPAQPSSLESRKKVKEERTFVPEPKRFSQQENVSEVPVGKGLLLRQGYGGQVGSSLQKGRQLKREVKIKKLRNIAPMIGNLDKESKGLSRSF